MHVSYPPGWHAGRESAATARGVGLRVGLRGHHLQRGCHVIRVLLGALVGPDGRGIPAAGRNCSQSVAASGVAYWQSAIGRNRSQAVAVGGSRRRRLGVAHWMVRQRRPSTVTEETEMAGAETVCDLVR